MNTVTNLVFNAVESMDSKGGTVSISTENRCVQQDIGPHEDVKKGDYVVLTVSDTGRGIPRQVIKKIFEPFFTTKKMGMSGSGLGLAVVWTAVEDHGGYINVKSRENEGTTFELYFPVLRQTEQSPKSGF